MLFYFSTLAILLLSLGCFLSIKPALGKPSEDEAEEEGEEGDGDGEADEDDDDRSILKTFYTLLILAYSTLLNGFYCSIQMFEIRCLP